MENKLTNEEIARVFAMYWGCETNAGTVYSLLSYYKHFGDFNNCKLLLTPLSSITDEHAIKVTEIAGSGDKGIVPTIYQKDALVKRISDLWQRAGLGNIYLFQQLILWEYAVPLYFGINHWANGKTAIQLKIAIEK